jgi:hypothetical protein
VDDDPDMRDLLERAWVPEAPVNLRRPLGVLRMVRVGDCS